MDGCKTDFERGERMTALRERIARVSGAVKFALLVCCVMALFWFSQAVQAAIKNSINYCLGVLVPSLFPFMAVTNLAVNSDIGRVISRRLGWAARWLFRLPGECAAAVIFGLIGGYPTGAAATAALLKQKKIDEEQAGRMLLFCVSPGIAFSVTFLGGGIFGSYAVGWRLFAAVTLAAVLCGVISSVGRPIPRAESVGAPSPQSGTLVLAVSSASSAALRMCSFIVVFSALMALLHSTGVFQRLVRLISLFGIAPTDAAVLLSFMAEVTGGVGTAQVFRANAAMYAFGLGFGGICVHLQLFSFFGYAPTGMWKFLSFRVLHGALAAIIYTGINRLWPTNAVPVTAVFSAFGRSASLSLSPMGGLSLIMMCMAFLLITGSAVEK